jgi:hypothetical protein
MMAKSSEEADAMSDYTEAEGLRAEITRLIAVEKTLDEEFWALPEGSAAAASTARAAGQIGDQIRRLEVKLWEAQCHRPQPNRKVGTRLTHMAVTAPRAQPSHRKS